MYDYVTARLSLRLLPENEYLDENWSMPLHMRSPITSVDDSIALPIFESVSEEDATDKPWADSS